MRLFLARNWAFRGCLLAFALVAVLPTLAALGQSLFPGGRLSVDAYREAAAAGQGGLLLRSVAIAGGAMLFALIVGVPLGLLASRTDLPGRRLWWSLCFVPLLIPPYVMATCLIELLGTHGLVSGWLRGVLGPGTTGVSPYGPLRAALSLGLSFWPVAAVLTGWGARGVDPELEDAAKLETTPLGTLRRVTLPVTAPAIYAAALFAFLLAITDLGAPDVLYTTVYTTAVLERYTAGASVPVGAATATPLVLIGLLVAGAAYLAARQSAPAMQPAHAPSLLALGPWRWSLTIAVAGLLLLVVGLPVAALVRSADGGESYARVWLDSWPQFARSAAYSGLATAVALVLAWPVAYALARPAGPAARAVGLAAVLPVAVPAIFVGLGMLIAWQSWWPTQGPLAQARWLGLPVGYAAHLAPFAVGALAASLAQRSVELEEDAILAGASLLQLWRHAAANLARPGIFAGAAIVFILGIREYAITLLIAPPGGDTATLQLLQLMHYGADERVAAMSLMLIGLTLVPAALLLAVRSAWKQGGTS
jgi:iron(III) transport system permease protein